jgi:hypothetical protein
MIFYESNISAGSSTSLVSYILKPNIKTMNRTLHALGVTPIIFALSLNLAAGQGCVAIRGLSGCSGFTGGSIFLQPGESQVGLNFRYFKSFRHFRGKEEETQRIEEGTQVINHSYFLDLTLNYAITSRLSANLVLPFVYHTRSSMYEHGGNPPNGLGERHITSASGLADMRISAGYWIFNPENHHNYNLSVGLGFKIPTGNYRATDLFYNQGPDRNEDREAVVDQSIQPGDGGFGVSIELQGFYMISENFLINGNFYYLFNPEETNGVLTRNGSSEFSVPDQYAIRLGVNYLTPFHGLTVYLGGRDECVPATDLIGGSDGYRRPGYVISIEPGISYSLGRLSAFVSVPIALERNRTQSYLDKKRTEETGVYRHGDAAFADYLINASISWRINLKKPRLKLIDLES